MHLANITYKGNTVKAKEAIAQLLSENNLNEKSNVYDKFKVLQLYCKETVKTAETGITTYTEGFGLEGYEKNVVLPAYTAAFGTENDLPKLIYNGIKARRGNEHGVRESAKFAVVAGAALSGMPEGALVLTTASTSIAVDVSDRILSKEGMQDSDLKDISSSALKTTLFTYGLGTLFNLIKSERYKLVEHTTTTGAEMGINSALRPRVEKTVLGYIDFDIMM